MRNLPYTSSEEDLEKLFSKYGRGAASGSPYTPVASGLSSCMPGLNLRLMASFSGLSLLIHKMGFTISQLLSDRM